MSASYPNAGRFVWRELMTPDVDRAKAFYGAVFGWEWADWDMGGYVYSGIRLGERNIGGIMALPPEGGVPTCWGSYLAVDDVDATAALAAKLGGDVVHPPQDIPNVGRFAVVRDSTGAVFTAFREAGTGGVIPEQFPEHSFCWETVSTGDSARTREFYAAIAGWKTQSGPAAGIELFTTAEGQMLADIQPASAAWPACWITYVVVANLESTLTRVVTHGGQVVVPKVAIPMTGRIAVFADPSGAMLGIFEPAAR